MTTPEGALQLGGSSFYDVPFPLVVGDRYIHLRMDAAEPVCQVWRWDASAGVALREPDPVGQAADVQVEPSGTGGFELTFRALPGEDLLSGQSVHGDLRIVCRPTDIRAYRGTSLIATLSGAQIHGLQIGIKIDREGLTVGAQLPAGFVYQIDYVNRRVQLARLLSGPGAPVIANTKFVHCSIEGPAVITGEDVRINRCNWDLLGAPPESLYVRLADPAWAYGAIILRHVDIEDCNLINVAIAAATERSSYAAAFWELRT